MIKDTGVYMILSIDYPDRVYIGSSVNIRTRWNNHRHYLRTNSHHSPKFQNHYNKYGENDFVFIVIEKCNEVVLRDREQYYLDVLTPYFNICPKADGVAGRPSKKKGVPSGVVPWNKGRKNVYSKETRLEMSKGRLNKEPWNKNKKGCYSEATIQKMKKPKSDEHKKKLSEAHAGVPLSKEHTQHAKAARKLKHPHRTEETKEKLRLANLGEKNPMFGKKPSKETNKKRSISLKKSWILRKEKRKNKDDKTRDTKFSERSSE
jgi:group I intron endonuclease